MNPKLNNLKTHQDMILQLRWIMNWIPTNSPEEFPIVFNPCCGEGSFGGLSNYRCQTFGIEIDGGRAHRARKRIDIIERGNAFRDFVFAEAFASVLVLHPDPFDERDWIGKFTHTLCDKGVLFLINSSPVLSLAEKRALEHFDVLKCFSAQDTGQFVFVCQLSPSNVDRGHRHRIPANPFPSYKSWMVDIPVRPLEYRSGEKFYEANAQRSLGSRSHLSASDLSVEMLSRIKHLKSDLYDRIHSRECDRPVMPVVPQALHTGHLGLLMASGYLDGLIGSGPDRHLIKGQVRRAVVSNLDEEGSQVQSTLYKIMIHMLCPDGTLRCLVSGE